MKPISDDRASTSKPGAGSQDPQDSTPGTGTTPNTTLIEVSYASDGTPSVEPAESHVEEGREAVWRAALGESRPFRVVFPAASPAETGSTERHATGSTTSGTQPPALVLDSKIEEQRQTCRLTARRGPGKQMFEYTVEANGGAVQALLAIDFMAAIPEGVVHPK